jgi:hypothetical protein
MRRTLSASARVAGYSVRRVFILAGGILIGIGIPVFWVWVGSHFQQGTFPSMPAILTVLAGVVASYWLLGLLIAWVRGRSEARAHGGRVPTSRYAWNRSMRAERHRPGESSHFLEAVVIAAAIIVALVATIWFFFFGDPGIRPGTG